MPASIDATYTFSSGFGKGCVLAEVLSVGSTQAVSARSAIRAGAVTAL